MKRYQLFGEAWYLHLHSQTLGISEDPNLNISTAVNTSKLEENPIWGYGSLVVKLVASFSEWSVSAWLTVTIYCPVETLENVQF
jgi:hypothetical protein